jgi:hypothetical protein
MMSEKREICPTDVVVRLEVIVPQSGASASPAVLSTERRLLTDPPVIDEPGPPDGGGKPQSRLVRTTSKQSFMCAYGHGANGATFVFAKAYPNNTPDTNPPNGTLWMTPSSGNWNFGNANNLEIPGVAAGQTNTLAVWSYFSASNSFGRQTVQFMATSSTTTQCRAGSGSGSGSGSIITRPGTGATVPRQWTVTAAAFTAGVMVVFNAHWLLTLRQPADKELVWDNGADGKGSPLVALRREGPLWVLAFRFGGSTVWYTKSAAEWQPLGANVLSQAAPDQAEGVPQAVTIVPV